MFDELKSLIIKPSIHHHSYSHDICDDTVPNEFSILCWNVHKNNDTFAFKNYIENFSEKKPVDFFVFQEADFKHDIELNLPGLTFNAAANLEKGSAFYGVLTATKCKTIHSKPFLSHGKELIFGPRKSLLLTKHTFENGTTLLILNLHAINFRENKHYFKEIDRIIKIIDDYTGPMIIAGDFNSWNKKRMDFLHAKMEHLNFTAVPFSKSDKVKSFMRNHLDFIFYRGIKLTEYSIERTHKLSDHHPLFAKFIYSSQVNA
jgi:endonuclease/exonuclease/phosphatase (EEP) superfamily protein YafD